MRTFVFVAFASVVAALAGGCSSTILKKPEINKVRKVAIVSLYADGTIPWSSGKGAAAGAPKAKMENFDPETKQRVATEAYKSFSEQFKRLGWVAIPLEQVTASSSYKKTFGPQQAGPDSNVLAKAAHYLGNNQNSRYFTPPGLVPIAWAEEQQASAAYKLDLNSFKLEKKKELRAELADLARDLGVDAVALVYLDYCYTGAFSLVGPEKAKMTAGSSVRMVNRDQVLVVDMKPGKNRCEGARGESQKTVPMFKGSITLGRLVAADALVSALIEATQATARVTSDQLQAGLSK